MAAYEATVRDVCVMDWTLERAGTELNDWPRTIGLADASQPCPGLRSRPSGLAASRLRGTGMQSRPLSLCFR
jgi:hypothetical protein